MTLITLKISNAKTEKLVYQFADKLNIEYYKNNSQSSTQKKEAIFFETLDELASQIKTSSFGDSVKWQKEQRKDRKLPNR